MPVDVHLLDGWIGGGVGRHGAVGSFIRVKGIIQAIGFFEGFQLSDDTVGIFGIVFSNPGLNAGSVKEKHGSFIGYQSVGRSVRSDQQDGRTWIVSPIRKSCLKRVNLEASGTTEKPQKSRSSWEYFRKTIRREVVGIEKISCNNRALSIG